jgi:hypothetical protein
LAGLGVGFFLVVITSSRHKKAPTIFGRGMMYS